MGSCGCVVHVTGAGPIEPMGVAMGENTEPNPSEVASMGRYLGIAAERGEAYLMCVAREAVMAPVLAPWQVPTKKSRVSREITEGYTKI